MLTAERKRFIVEALGRDGKVLAHDLSVELSVSEDTIRRDLRDLAAEGLLQRVHGGALPPSPASGTYYARQQQAPQAKHAIAQAAARLIQNGQVVLLDGGTTNVQVAQHLPHDLHATIITHSPPVAMALSEHPNVDVVMLGGFLYKRALVAVGPATLEALRSVRADVYMLGVSSLHPEVGISTQDLGEAHVKRAMIESSAEVVALASAEKLGTAAPYIVRPLDEITHLITETGVPESILEPYRDTGMTIEQV